MTSKWQSWNSNLGLFTSNLSDFQRPPLYNGFWCISFVQGWTENEIGDLNNLLSHKMLNSSVTPIPGTWNILSNQFKWTLGINRHMCDQLTLNQDRLWKVEQNAKRNKKKRWILRLGIWEDFIEMMATQLHLQRWPGLWASVRINKWAPGICHKPSPPAISESQWQEPQLIPLSIVHCSQHRPWS